MSEYSKRKNAVVIGGAGFIGSNLCEALVKHSNVVCVDNYSTGHESNIDSLLSDKHFEFIRHDITVPLDFSKHQDGVERFQFQQSGINQIYFLASPGSPDWHFKDPLGTMMIHSVGIRNALEIARTFNSTVVYVSDALVYGTLPDAKFHPTEEFSGTLPHGSPAESHPPRETLSLGNSLPDRVRPPDRARRTDVHRAVALGPPMKVMAFHRPLEPLPLRHAGDVDPLRFFQDRHGHHVSRL